MITPTLPFDLMLIVKIIFLIVIGMYCIFVFIVFANIRSLNKLILIERSSGSPLINTVTFIYLLLTISLFIAALVIL